MADQPAAQTARRPSTARRLALAIPFLLAAAVIVNWGSIRAIAGHQKTPWEVIAGREQRAAAYKFPAPSGPAEAKIKVSVIAREGHQCHRPLIALWLGIGRLESERIHLEFLRPDQAPKIGPKGKPVELGCSAGVLINGHNKFVLGSGKDKRTIYLNGPGPKPANVPSAVQAHSSLSHGGHGWALDDIATILNRLLKEKYGTSGTLTAKRIQEAAAVADSLIPLAKSQPGARPTAGPTQSGPTKSGATAMPSEQSPPKNGQ